MSLREMIRRHEISSLRYIPGTVNLADVLTKGADGKDIMWLLTNNQCVQVSTQEYKKRHDRAATNKQYLLQKNPR